MPLAIVGDTMLGRGVAEALTTVVPASLVEPELAALLREADATVLNLECCISDRGAPVRLPGISGTSRFSTRCTICRRPGSPGSVRVRTWRGPDSRSR
jgi:hypothetical protein